MSTIAIPEQLSASLGNFLVKLVNPEAYEGARLVFALQKHSYLHRKKSPVLKGKIVFEISGFEDEGDSSSV